MRVISGLGNIPPVRRWDAASMLGVRGRASLPSPVAATKPIYSPTFNVVAAGYGIAPPANVGEPISALRGLGADCDEGVVKGIRDNLTSMLPRLSPGIQVTVTNILKQTEGTFTQCSFRLNLLEQARSAAVNDLRAQAGAAPKTANEMANSLAAGSDAAAAAAAGGGPSAPSFWDNFYKDGKLTPVGIGSIVAGGLLIAAIGTGTAGALLGRRR